MDTTEESVCGQNPESSNNNRYLVWELWKGDYSLKETRMMIRPGEETEILWQGDEVPGLESGTDWLERLNQSENQQLKESEAISQVSSSHFIQYNSI